MTVSSMRVNDIKRMNARMNNERNRRSLSLLYHEFISSEHREPERVASQSGMT